MAQSAGKLVAAAPMPALRVPPDQWPAGIVEFRALDQLKPHPRNARVHPESQIAEIIASIAEHGFAKLSIVIDEADQILAGHGNVIALKRFGAQIERVPVTVVRGWSDAQKRAFMLRDNKIPQNSRWDMRIVGEELAELAELPEIDVTDLGFSDKEMRRLLPDAGEVQLPTQRAARSTPAARAKPSKALNVCCPKCGTTFLVTPGSV